MNFFRAMLALVLGSALLGTGALRAQETPPFDIQQPFSADVEITTKKGPTSQQHICCDNGKIRSEMTAHGMAITSIVRPDQQKIYAILASQKMVMEIPYNRESFKDEMALMNDGHLKFELVSSDTVDGIACNKYRVTPDSGTKTYLFWLDAARKAPLKMAAEDGTFSLVWKSYQAGPQDAALFEVPAGYSIMNMPGKFKQSDSPAGA